MGKEERYIYGIIRKNEKKSFGPCGINADEEVYIISHQDISCVVSNSPIQDYSTMLKEDLGRLLVKHQTIIEKIIKDHTAIPVKFGTFVSDDDEAIEVLKRGYTQLKELLSSMDGKIEFDVAATWNDLNSVIKEIAERDKGIMEFKAEISKRPPAETLQERIKIGVMIKDALDKRKEKESSHIIDFLQKEAVDFQKHQVMDDKMVLNCAFLLEKNKEADFDLLLKELDTEYGQKLNFRCIGPLPPYSFATCQLMRVGFNQVDEARRLLGLKENISLDEIKESYRNFAQKNHPDKAPGNGRPEEEFEKTTQAYKLLTRVCQRGAINLTDTNQKDFVMVEITRP